MSHPPATMASSVKGLAAAALGTVAWGFAAILVKLTELSGLVLPFYRMWVGFIFMLVVALAVRGRPGWRVLRACVPGGLFLATNVAFYFTALKNTSVANATFIGALQPILVLILATRILGERLTRVQLAWMALALAGVASVVLGSGGFAGVRLGDLLAVGALLAWAGYWLASKRVRARLTTVEYMTGLFLVASLAVTPVVLTATGGQIGVARSLDWLWIGLLGLVPGAGHFLFNWAHGQVPAIISSLVQASMPVVATAAAFVILSEPVAAVQVAGGVFAVLAIAAIAATSAREPSAASG